MYNEEQGEEDREREKHGRSKGCDRRSERRVETMWKGGNEEGRRERNSKGIIISIEGQESVQRKNAEYVVKIN